MPQSYFIFKGIDSRAMAVVQKTATPIVRGEEAVNRVTIPGRAGELTILEGEDIYRGYIQTVSISVYTANAAHNAMAWLKGSGKVTFSSEPHLEQHARVMGAVTLQKVSRNLDIWAGEVQFYCEPFKRKRQSDSVTITAPTIIRNNGDSPTSPKITANFIAGTAFSIDIVGNSFSVDMSGRAENSVVIDGESELVTTVDGETNLTAFSSGAFPKLKKGTSLVGGSGWVSLKIEKNELYL